MLRTFKIKALIKGKRDVVIGQVTVMDIENVKEGFSRHGHLILDHEVVETDVEAVKRLLPIYLREV